MLYLPPEPDAEASSEQEHWTGHVPRHVVNVEKHKPRGLVGRRFPPELRCLIEALSLRRRGLAASSSPLCRDDR